MTTEQTAQQLELAAQILRTGHPFEVRHDALNKWHASLGVNPAQAVLQDWHLRPVLATPPDNRPLHNPDNLTAEQIGVGYRLLCAEDGVPIGKVDTWLFGGWCSAYVVDKQRLHECRDTYRLPLRIPWPEPADPYAELKKAHAEGRVIQSFNRERSIWQDCPSPAFEGGTEYRVKPEAPAFQLPPPPPGMQWHRTDGWQERDLPQGMRPLVVNEESQPDDEHWISGRGLWKALNRGGIIYDEGHTRCRTRRPLTFTHAGKTWTWHRPGDPRPCDGEKEVEIMLQNGLIGSCLASLTMSWSHGDNQIIGWRYADEKKTDDETIQELSDKEILQLRNILTCFTNLSKTLNENG